MVLKKVIGAAVGTVGIAAIGNRALERRVEPLGPPLERETGSYRWRGMEISYTEGGDPEDPDMLLVHGVHLAGTSREFNRIFDRLAESYHVFAPDLPGFGRSDRPPLTYSATLFETFLEDFITDLTDRPICLASSLAGAFLVEAAHAVDIDRLLLVCPTSDLGSEGSRIAGGFLRTPIVGEAAFNLLASRIGLERFFAARMLYDPHALSERDITYFWQTAHQPGSRYVPSSLMTGRLHSNRDLGRALADLDPETTLIWGRAATAPPLQTGREIADTADTKLVVLDQAKVLPHLEQAGPFLDLLAEELEIPS